MHSNLVRCAVELRRGRVTDLAAVATGYAKGLVIDKFLRKVCAEIREVGCATEGQDYFLSLVVPGYESLGVGVRIVELLGDGGSEWRIGALRRICCGREVRIAHELGEEIV